MADEKNAPPISPATHAIVTVPRLVGKVLDDPQDEAEEAMALAIRDNALTQQAAEYLLTATRQAEERFALDVVASLDRVATTAKAVQAKYDGGSDIDRVMAGAMTAIVVSQIDSYTRQKTAMVEIAGEIAAQVQTLPSIRGKIARHAASTQQPVIVQAGPKLRKAPLFTLQQKYVIDPE